MHSSKYKIYRASEGGQHVANYKLFSIFFLLIIIAPHFAWGATFDNITPKQVTKTFELIKTKARKSIKIVPRNRFPIQTRANGEWQTTHASGWTSGFYPGILWLLYEQSGNKSFATEARLRENILQSQQFNNSTHDVGFMIFNSFGNAYRLQKNINDKKIILQTAKTLTTRFNPKIGLIKSWNNDQKVHQTIIDNLMNLELLFWAGKNGGDGKLLEVAKLHAKKTAQDFVREDGSTFHLVNYNPKNGKILSRTTAQGYSPNSTWARGQAWAIYGFSIAYRETQDETFLAAARKVADYYIKNLPDDFVPYWDFNVPDKTKEPRDSSAAAIAASGLLELSKLETNQTKSMEYQDAASKTLASISSDKYLGKNANQAGILLHGTYNRKANDFDKGTIWGDYYFIEALLKLQKFYQ